MTWKCTKDRFLDDVKNHEMTILHDDGLYRHIRFKKPTTSVQYFDLITTPKNLFYTGDMGTYAFSRMDDMFKFFYGKGEINPSFSYWAEKCTSESIFQNGVTQFDLEIFCDSVREYACDVFEKDDYEEFTEEEKESIITLLDSENEWEALVNLNKHYSSIIDFDDFFDYPIRDFTPAFLWACYAIQWGVNKYFGGFKETK